MSLLMDALKRAEQAKERGAATQGLSLEPLANNPPATAPAEGLAERSASDPVTSRADAGRLPSLNKLEDLDAEFIALAQQPPQRRAHSTGNTMSGRSASPASPPRQESAPTRARADIGASTPQQAAIRNVFAVKESPASGKFIWLTIAALTLAAVAAIGVYFWMQLRPTPGVGLAAPSLASTPLAPEMPATPPAPAIATASPTPIPLAPVEPPARPLAKAPVASKVSGGDTPPARAAPPAPPAPTPAQIRFARSVDRPTPSVAAEGYEALQAGNLAAARAAYERSLRTDPRGVDAMLGLAAIALREGRVEDAEAGYLRILEVDPRNAEAHAALAGLRGGSDPVQAESRIKSLLAQQPDMPALHFALGNLYARQHRWSEAQQAYFRAMTTDGDNPDYLFNLAVSLDQLHQSRLAADYYRRALKAAETRQAAFDRGMATQRLGELKQP
ncbi:MAG: tetratricopeptide repeat protein [Rhodocyclaceae bacterium]|nr:tetratricopeptide repeat protein [Rhodocyclaceae bacterium]